MPSTRCPFTGSQFAARLPMHRWSFDLVLSSPVTSGLGNRVFADLAAGDAERIQHIEGRVVPACRVQIAVVAIPVAGCTLVREVEECSILRREAPVDES